jgi:hypothetical protein
LYPLTFITHDKTLEIYRVPHRSREEFAALNSMCGYLMPERSGFPEREDADMPFTRPCQAGMGRRVSGGEPV